MELTCTEAIACSHSIRVLIRYLAYSICIRISMVVLLPPSLLSSCFHELDGTLHGVLSIILRSRQIPVGNHALLTLNDTLSISHLNGALYVGLCSK